MSPYGYPKLEVIRRSPHGERGLKLSIPKNTVMWRGSLPSRGAWIEISILAYHDIDILSLPSRGAWIEIYNRKKVDS